MNALMQQRKSEIASLWRDIQPLAEKSKTAGLSDEESTRFDELTEQFNRAGEAYKAAETQYQSAISVTAKFGEYRDLVADPAKTSRDTVHDVDTDVIRLSPGARFAESEQFKSAMKKTGPRPKMEKDNAVKFDGLLPVHGTAGLFDTLSKLSPEGVKAVLGSAGMSTSMLLPQVFPTIYRAGEAPLVMRDVLLNLTTQSDALIVMQESSFTNGAAEVAEATAVDGSGVTGGVKPESSMTFTEVTFPIKWIAHWVNVTRQNLEDLAFLRGYIDGRLLTGLARREDNQFLNGTGSGANLTGILATSGILNLDASYFSGAAVKNAGTDNENPNRIRRAITRLKLASVGGAMPSFIVANPADVEEWDTTTDENRQYLFGGPQAGSVTRMWGLPVVQSENIAAKTSLVGDGTMAAVVDRRDAEIYTTDSHADYFIRNLFVILAEERVGLVTFRPSGFAKVALAS